MEAVCFRIVARASIWVPQLVARFLSEPAPWVSILGSGECLCGIHWRLVVFNDVPVVILTNSYGEI